MRVLEEQVLLFHLAQLLLRNLSRDKNTRGSVSLGMRKTWARLRPLRTFNLSLVEMGPSFFEGTPCWPGVYREAKREPKKAEGCCRKVASVVLLLIS